MKAIIVDNFLNYFFKLLFVLINGLFIYKYGLRQHFVPVEFILIIYTISTSLILFKNIQQYINHKLNLQFCFKIIVIIAGFTIFLIIFKTDGTSLKVDRWSAMDVAIKALLNGKYPYTATDHLGGRTSNFPGLLILGIPFYLLGNVGYLQVFSFLLLSYTLYKNTPIKTAIKYLFLLIISPAFWWEIFSISDLMSNIIICFCFIIWWQSIFKNNLLAKPYLLGFSLAFLVLTRGIVAIPLILLFFKPFITIKLNLKIKLLFFFSTTFLVLIILVIFNCPSMEILKNYNPLVLQTSYLPTSIHLLAIILPFIFALNIKDFHNSYFKHAVILMLFPAFISFCFFWNEYGFKEIILNHKSDISYLSMVFPFLIYEISKTHKLIKINS